MKKWLLIGGLLIALAAAGYYFFLRPAATSSARQQAAVLIDWLPEPTYLGVYYAADLGLYDQAGLDVRIENVQGANRAVAALGSGGFDISTASGAATALSYNERQDILSVGVIYPKVATAVYGLSTSPVRTPADLAGKRVGIYPGSINNQEFAAFLERNGVDPARVEIVALSGSDVALLLEGRIDAAVNYAELSPEQLRTQLARLGRREQVWSIRLADSVDLGYGLNIVTTRAKASSRPEVIQRLSSAIYEGYRQGCARPAEAVAAFVRRFPEMNPSYVSQSWRVVCAQLAQPLGAQAVEGWRNTIAAVRRFGLLRNNGPSPEAIMWRAPGG
jgi:NitT/TauT family transport system substrate-binding protein